jgi:hypothetical protein
MDIKEFTITLDEYVVVDPVDGFCYFWSKSEFEANLFAVALLADDDINMKLSIPLEKMNNYLLKTIMDYNISTN